MIRPKPPTIAAAKLALENPFSKWKRYSASSSKISSSRWSLKASLGFNLPWRSFFLA